MVIPAKARRAARIEQGDIVKVQPQGDGRIILIRMEQQEKAAPIKAKITYRKGTHAVASTGRNVTSAQVREFLNEP